MRPAALLVILLFATAAAALWAVALVDVFQRDDWEFPRRGPGSNDRLFWTFVVVCLSSIGSFFYYLMVMRPHPRRHR
jgi:amino acid transporter